METENMLENSREKLKKKNLDLIVANNLKVDGAGFGTDTNVVTDSTKRPGVGIGKDEQRRGCRPAFDRDFQNNRSAMRRFRQEKVLKTCFHEFPV